MGLFSDIYNTVAKFFRPQEEQGDASKSVATNRLKLVLMQDRTNLTPKILEQMRGELIDLLSKYVELDKELLELNFEQEGEQVALMLSIPVIRAKEEEEIEAALNAAEQKAGSEEESDATEDSEDLENNEENQDEAIEIIEASSEENTEEISQDKPKSRKKKKTVSAPEELKEFDKAEEVSFENSEA